MGLDVGTNGDTARKNACATKSKRSRTRRATKDRSSAVRAPVFSLFLFGGDDDVHHTAF